MRKKVALIIGIITIISLIATISCSKCGDNTIYKVVDLYIEITGAQFSPQAANKMYYFDISNDSIYYSFLGFYIEPEMEAYVSIERRLQSFGLINTAYACDPVPATTDDHITNIEIIADQDYDDSHPKGSNLADYFDVIVTYHHTNVYDQKYELSQYLLKKPVVPDIMVLILNTKPKQDRKYRFTINYTQEGVSFNSKTVSFNPITILQ